MSEEPALCAPYTETAFLHTAPSQALAEVHCGMPRPAQAPENGQCVAEGGVGDGRELDTARSARSRLLQLVVFSARDVRVGEPPVGYLGASKPWDTSPLEGSHRYFKCEMLLVRRSVSRGGWPYSGPGTPTHPQSAPMQFSGGWVARVGGVTVRRAPSRARVGVAGLWLYWLHPQAGLRGSGRTRESSSNWQKPHL